MSRAREKERAEKNESERQRLGNKKIKRERQSKIETISNNDKIGNKG